MGADMLVAHLVLPPGREPDWDAGEKWIAGLGDLELTEIAQDPAFEPREDGDVEGVRAILRERLAALQTAESSREFSSIEIGGCKVWITGGMSWGDSPTELFDDFIDATNSGLAEACGFTTDSGTNSIRLILGTMLEPEHGSA